MLGSGYEMLSRVDRHHGNPFFPASLHKPIADKPRGPADKDWVHVVYITCMSIYDERLVAPMRNELTRLGVEELRTADAVDAKLRGSTGTYGFLELSAATAEVEEALLEAGGPPGPEVKERVARRVKDALREAERIAK